MVISPILSYNYLHYALDLWFEKLFHKRCFGIARLIRFCDGFVCFRFKTNAEKFCGEARMRPGKFREEVELSETRVGRVTDNLPGIKIRGFYWRRWVEDIVYFSLITSILVLFHNCNAQKINILCSRI